ncbi:MAG: hypothetical protein R3280_01425 [Marinobacter sp.]|uniref:NAD(P)H-binding protein n=1 Tax=Marinobacter sp. TaxID=50741 RepID=UPI00299EEA5F|nr:NAD(P)H-binding protein [Marinobacter sp.]MDX1633274.1 hypothetical protein [Marinobacter sp.]
MDVLILGATGAVGSQVLAQAKTDKNVRRIVAPTRRPLDSSAEVENPVLDFRLPLPEADWWRVDAVICCLGTTLRKAGSKRAFHAIDHDLVLACARHAREAGARIFVLNSSLGADPDSRNFYLRTKGEVERELETMGFERLVKVRPSLIDAERPEARPAEKLGLLAGRLLKPLIPGRYRPVSADAIAATLLSELQGGKGIVTVESDRISPART